MSKITNEAGNRYGRLFVIGFHSIKKRRARWNCICDCGRQKVALGYTLRNGKTKSCGCYHVDRVRESCMTHGSTVGRVYTGKVPTEYSTWNNIKQRCLNLNNKNFDRYGGRGIKICKRWLNFKNFIKDMGQKPNLKSTINRKNNNGNYTSKNCHWTTMKCQQRNRISNRVLGDFGKKRCQSEWAELLGCTSGAIAHRIKSGWSVSDAVSVKIGAKRTA